MSRYDERQALYAAERQRDRRWFWDELTEAFDHRHDNVTAGRKFEDHLGIYATLFTNGSKCLPLSELVQAERRLLKARGVKSVDMPKPWPSRDCVTNSTPPKPGDNPKVRAADHQKQPLVTAT